jgi:DNA (cytosine-5)-methyltransferase 1
MKAVDLFCGAGGTTTGLLLAAAELGRTVDLLAINHWNVAIDTHTRNHPGVRHLCESLDNIDPRKAVAGRLHLLCASPECTHHSIARGGRPKSDQSRASAWHVVRWAEAQMPDAILVENVREFKDWGPLTKKGKPVQRKKGKTFVAFCVALESLGYSVEHRILNAADYGDPTTRQRLFVMARKGRKVTWPEATHKGRWRSAREVIDWGLKGESIFQRKRPLSANTLRRIAAGLMRFGGGAFVLPPEGVHRGNAPRPADSPLATITQRGGGVLCEPFLVHTCHAGGDRVHSVEKPLPTVTCGHRGEMALVEPFVIGQQSCAAARPVTQPLPTVATAGAIALIQPFLVKYYGTGESRPVTEPLDTVTTRDRFGLVQPAVEIEGERYLLDIRFRMLQPHELSAAMGFPAGYQFAGTKGCQVKQIGNAVAVNTAKALCKEVLR